MYQTDQNIVYRYFKHQIRIRASVSQEEWAVHLSDMLLVNSSLVELHLGTMGLTDTGMERLAEGLKLNYSLLYLDLRW